MKANELRERALSKNKASLIPMAVMNKLFNAASEGRFKQSVEFEEFKISKDQIDTLDRLEEILNRIENYFTYKGYSVFIDHPFADKTQVPNRIIISW